MELTIGRNIRTIRNQRGISQKELARRVGVSQVHISSIERGERRASISVLLKIMEALKCSPTDMKDRKQSVADNKRSSGTAWDFQAGYTKKLT